MVTNGGRKSLVNKHYYDNVKPGDLFVWTEKPGQEEGPNFIISILILSHFFPRENTHLALAAFFYVNGNVLIHEVYDNSVSPIFWTRIE